MPEDDRTTATTPRWFFDNPADHSTRYVSRFRALAAENADLAGEARFVDALLPRHARVLDAGCGPGRVAAELAHRGHEVVGVDADPVLIDAAREDHPGPVWVEQDLAELDLEGPPFDAVVLAGNVMVFLAPDSEVRVLERLAAHLTADGAVIAGFATDRAYRLSDFDRDAAAAGLDVEHRFATWDLAPWRPESTWAVTVLRRTSARPRSTGPT